MSVFCMGKPEKASQRRRHSRPRFTNQFPGDSTRQEESRHAGTCARHAKDVLGSLEVAPQGLQGPSDLSKE